MFSSKLPRQVGIITSRAMIRFSSTVARSSAAALSSQRWGPSLKHASAHPLPGRTFSTAMMPRRAYPQYSIFGPSSALSVRAILPQFKRAGADGVSVDRRGKLVLEFVPRSQTGAGFLWQEKTIFSLSVEEVGLCLSQLPGNEVELSHAVQTGGSDDEDASMGVTQLSGDMVDKVLTIQHGEGSSFKFKVDYTVNGVGGQVPPGSDGFTHTPLEVTVQAGELEILKSIFQTSLPYLLGWNTTMDIASANAISRGVMGPGPGGNMY